MFKILNIGMGQQILNVNFYMQFQDLIACQSQAYFLQKNIPNNPIKKCLSGDRYLLWGVLYGRQGN
jgi:hypothetical protein